MIKIPVLWAFVSVAAWAQDYIKISNVEGDLINKIFIKITADQKFKYDPGTYVTRVDVDPELQVRDFKTGQFISGSIAKLDGGYCLVEVEIENLKVDEWVKFKTGYAPKINKSSIKTAIKLGQGKEGVLAGISGIRGSVVSETRIEIVDELAIPK